MEKQWSLESIDTDGNRVDFVISRLPCRVGRSKDNDLVIEWPEVCILPETSAA